MSGHLGPRPIRREWLNYALIIDGYTPTYPIVLQRLRPMPSSHSWGYVQHDI